MDRDKGQDIAKKVGEKPKLQQDHEYREAQRKNGQKSGGNFKNDPKRAAEAGRKGGEGERNT